MFAANNHLLWMLAGTFAALGVGTLVRIVALRDAAADLVNKRMGSLKVWWTLTALMSIAVLFGHYGAALCLSIASWLGLREILRLVGMEQIGRPATIAAFATVPLQYGLLVGGYNAAAIAALPVGFLIALCAVRSIHGVTAGYIRTTAAVFLSVLLLVYCLSYTVLLFSLPNEGIAVGNAGWFLFVVVLTEMNDIMQAVVGRKIGRRKITPVSPNKTWEGLAGGMITTVGLSLLLSPWLTTFAALSSSRGIRMSVAAGVVISICGFLGDINMSAIKRGAGVKDGSSLLPGMGGIIDRIDSLTFTAPVFYYFVRYLVSLDSATF